MRNDDTVWEVRGKHFSRTRCQNLSVRGQRVSLFLFSIFLSFSLSIFLSTPAAPRCRCPFSLALFLPSSFFLSFRDLAVIPPTRAVRGSQLGKKNPKKHRRCWRWRRALNTSPTQHHDSLQLHKCVFFPIRSTLPELSLPVRAQLDLVLKAKHLPENPSDGCTCVRAQLFILKFLFFFFFNFTPAN